MSKLKYFLPLVIFVVLGVFLFYGISHDPTEMPSALIDKPMPKFALSALESEPLVSEGDLRGQVTLLNVWATWCVSCRMEHPYLVQLAKQGVWIVGVNYKDDPKEAKKWLKELGNPYALNIIDKDGKLGLDLGVYGAPESYLLDKKGVIRYKRVGVIDERVWREQIQPLYQKLNNQ